MDVSSVKGNQSSAYNVTETSGKTASEETSSKGTSTKETAPKESEAASFEKNGGHSYSSSATRKTYKMDTETVERLKSENEQRMANLVKQMLSQQIDKSNMWERLRTGNFTADAATIKQAQADIADDGYWGVEQTSDRLVQYATALTGGDPEKLDTMIAAFEKGYAAAEKTWGGKLPELAQRTREATLKKFQDLKNQYAKSSGSVTETEKSGKAADE